MPTPSGNSSPAASPEDWRAGGFGVYVHWPFCAAKCPYCDFNSHVTAAVDHDRWARALEHEIARTAREVPGRTVSSVFFGGGTPSLMAPETVATVIDAIGKAWRLAPDAEITLEANPTSVEAGRFRAYRAAGVNRVSLGVQALNDADLKALGRRHSAAEALAAFETARAIFERVSFDLIYARQRQSLEGWETELRQAAEIAVDHLSLYQLTIEPNTRFGELFARNRLRDLPDAELSADMYERTQEVLARRGMACYEISNHARPGAECRHNLVYWRYGDYAGIGPGAHGRLSLSGRRVATIARPSPTDWLQAVETTGSGVQETEDLAPEVQAEEMLMMGLRLAEGIDPCRHEALAGRPLPRAALDELQSLGLAELAPGRLRVTPKGRAVLNSVLNSLLNQ